MAACGGYPAPRSAVQLVAPAKPVKYYVKVTGANGCSALDSVQVNVSTTDRPSFFDMPTAFSPNNDGRNDCFGIKFPGLNGQLEFNIYDRWGNVVFRTADMNTCWDGTYKGIPLDIGTFVYWFRLTSACGMVERRGTVTLLR